MKKLGMIGLLLCVLFGFTASAQVEKDPAHWAYGLKKTGEVYEVHLRCSIDTPWHIYAQNQGADFIGTKTKIVFAKTENVILIGKPVELGKKFTYVNKEAGISNQEYSGMVDFVQKVKLKPGVKAIKGTITYQTCTDTRCLQPVNLNFSVPVDQ